MSGTGGEIITPKRIEPQRGRRRRPRRGAPRRETPVRSSGPPARFSWRWMSGSLVVLIGLALGIIFSNPVFYVTQIEVGGARSITPEELFAHTQIAGYHILWIDPVVIAERILDSSPNIETAEVTVLWPARVVVYIQEREPALVWEYEGSRFWVDVNGNVMPERYDVPGLVHIVSEAGSPLPYRRPDPNLPEGAAVLDPSVILGAQNLRTLRSNIDVLYYDSVRGLSYQDGRGWRVYFGVGTDMSRRLVIYEELVDSLLARGVHPAYINVANPDAPFYGVEGSQP